MPETVHILAESRLTLPTGPGVLREMISLTYAAAGLAPRIVYIDPDHDSPEERKAKIAADLKQARAATPTQVDLD